MRFNLKKSITSMAFAAGLATAAFAIDTPRNIDIKLDDADLVKATETLHRLTGIQFVVQPSAKGFDRVTLALKQATPEDAIKYMCVAAKAYFKREESGVYVISSEPFAEAAPKAAEAKKAKKQFRKVLLMHQDPKAIYDQMMFARIEDPTAKMADLRRLQQVVSPNLRAGNSFWDNATANPMSAPPSTQAASNTVRLPGEAAGQMGGGMMGGGMGGGMGMGGGGLGGGGLGGGGLGGGGLGGGQFGGGGQLTSGQGLVPSSIEFISYDPTDNSLIIVGTNEDDINELINYINSLDVKAKQVSIKVEFITTSETLDKSIGFAFQFQRGSVVLGPNPADFLRVPDPVFLTYASGNAVMRLRTRLSEGNGKLVTAPIIRTLNNTPAFVSAFTTTYILSTFQTLQPGGNVISQIQPQPIQAGTSLAVTPRINNDGDVVMALAPTVGGITGQQSIPNLGQLPIIQQQFLSVTARVKDGETIVLGGLNTENQSFNVEKVPILADLPIIGQFFQRRLTTKSNSELLVFVTPKIIEDDSQGGLGPI